MDVISYFRVEIETVGRHWIDVLRAFDAEASLVRPAPNVNHVLWLTGHMAWAEDYFLLEVPTGQSVRNKSWDRLFDHSSEKLASEEYPPFAEVAESYRTIHARALEELGTLTAARLGQSTHTATRWFPTLAHAVSHQVTHGHYHLGQFLLLERLRQAGKLSS